MRPRLHRLLERGTLMDISKLRVFLRTNLGDMTFAEAYKLTGRVFNVSVLSTQNEPALVMFHLLDFLFFNFDLELFFLKKNKINF